MEFPQSTTAQIIESEHLLTLTAVERFGEYFIQAMAANDLLNDFLESVDPDRYIFVIFLSHIRKHLLLSILSAVRLHKTQAMMDMRQVLESGTAAAFAIAYPDVAGFADIDENGIIDATKELAAKRYRWLEDNFPEISRSIKGMKDAINSSTAHSNIAYAMQSFTADFRAGRFITPFFDHEDDYGVKGDLWMMSDVAYGLMDLFFGVNRGKDVIKFRPDFSDRLRKIRAINERLKAAIMTTDRYKKSAQF